MSSNVSQSPSFDLSKTPPKLSNKQVLFKNNNKPTKRSTKSRYNKNNMVNYNTTIDNSSSYSHNNNNNKNNKPLKVVHISNPMRFQATAAEFRALVQGLTGRDAVVVDDDVHCRVTHQATSAAGGDDDDDDGGHHGCDNSNDDDDDKVLSHHHHQHHHEQHQHQHQHQQEVNLSACFGPSDHLSFDDVGAFNGDLVLMEELRAFMGDDGYYY